MIYAGTNLLAVIIAAAAAFVFGGAYYGALSKQWAKAARIDASNAKMGPVHIITSLVAELIMAFMLAGIIGHLGQFGIWNGIVTGFFIWLGFLVTSIAMSHRYQGFGWDLTFIDGVHWLGVLVLMGAIIGWFGVSA